jgi:glucose-1-phosphate cytidylyltransferase
MKVVLFCGGMGTRLRDHSDVTPKPLVNIGNRPILWHIMDYYAAFGHTEFILCLGYLGDQIREYFFNFDSYMAGDVTLERGRKQKHFERGDINDWTITLVDTGLHSNIGERLRRVRHYLDGDSMFLANYADQLSDLSLNAYIQEFETTGAIAGFLSVKPPSSFHAVKSDAQGFVSGFAPMAESGQWLNGGFFVMKQEIFDFVEPGNELVDEPFRRLASRSKLWTRRHEGFWRPMDTFKDKIAYDRMWSAEDVPWRRVHASLVQPDDKYRFRSAN